MIRALIIVVNLVILMVVKLFVASPYAEVKAPSTVKAGESFLVEVKIATNDETDFMRYSMEFPEGWLVEKVETAGSTFKYEKHTVKFLWSRVGEVKELNISYRVTPPVTVSGEFTMNCKLSHTVDNLPANIALQPMIIDVTENSGGTQKVVADSTAKPPVSIGIDRFVPTKEVGEEFVVSLVINKDDLTSFGKIEDTLPSGFTATSIKTDGADFKFENGVVKFSWFVMPAKHVLNVQYRVTVDPSVSGDQTIVGHFSYIENETGKLIAIPASVIKGKEQPIVTKEEPIVIIEVPVITKEEPIVTKEEPAVTKEEPVVTKEEPVVTKEEPIVAKEEPVVTKEEPVILKEEPLVTREEPVAKAAAAGVTYSVQVGAYRRMLAVSYFREAFSFKAIVNAEQHEGLNKYTTGIFNSYHAARDNRNEVRTIGIFDAFVIAYNNGKRITVQEALMITSQKWIQ